MVQWRCHMTTNKEFEFKINGATTTTLEWVERLLRLETFAGDIMFI